MKKLCIFALTPLFLQACVISTAIDIAGETVETGVELTGATVATGAKVTGAVVGGTVDAIIPGDQSGDDKNKKK